MAGSPTAQPSSNGFGRRKEKQSLPRRPQHSNRTFGRAPGRRRSHAPANQRRQLAGPRTLGQSGPAPRCCLWCRPGAARGTTTFAGRRGGAAGRRRAGGPGWPRSRRRRTGGGGERRTAGFPRPPSRNLRGAERPGLGSRHVGEHGGAAAPGHDQPVRAGRGLRGGPGEAAAAGGPLAVRDRTEHVFPRNQHSQQPPPPPDDVHPQQHACHAPQLPRRAGHVLQAPRLREPAEWPQPHDGRGLLPPCKLQPLLGLVPPQPPGGLDPTLLPHGPQLPPPAPPTAHVAPRSAAGGRPAEGRGRPGRAEMRDWVPPALGWSGGQGRGGTEEGGQLGRAGGFLKIALEDFIKEFLWGVGWAVNFLSHLGPSGVSLQASFSLFNI